MGGGGVVVHGGDVNITVQGNADEKAMNLMKLEFAKRDAVLSHRVVAAVTDAKRRKTL